MPVEVFLGRALAFCVHPCAGWRRLRPSGRLLLIGAYVAAGYVTVLTMLLVT